jgi:hypothetical protein
MRMENTKIESDGEPMELTKQEKKTLMRALWSALLEPKWTKDDLIDFGKAIFAKKSLREMDDKVFEQIFPFLDEITASLGRKLQIAAIEEAALSPPEQEQGKEKAAAEEQST